MNFKINDKVVCIDAVSANTPHKDYPTPIDVVVENEIYKIRYIKEDADGVWFSFYGKALDTLFHSMDYRKLDYDFVESVLSQIKKEPITGLKL